MSELSFSANDTMNPSPNKIYTDIRNVNNYTFMTDSYTGKGGYADGSYILPFARESWLEQRKVLASYRNFIKPIINSIIEPVFNSTVLRESEDKMYMSFLEDVDRANTPINEHCLQVATLSRLHGVAFTVMDNLPSGAVPLIKEEAINQRAYPYVYIQTADTVSDYTTDSFGKLTTITFHSRVKINDKFMDKYVTWSEFYTETMIKDGDKTISVETNYHNLGVLPVIPTYSVDDGILPMPPFYDIAKINYNIYNKDSEVRDQERAQAFSIFYLQTDNAENIVIGPHNAIIIPANEEISIPPGYCSPDPNILTVLNENTEKLIESIYKAAEDNGIVGFRQATSGIAEAYKFRGTNRQLQRTAKIIENYENRLAELFARYVNEEIDYKVAYPKEYEPKITIENIDNTIKLLGLDISDDLKKEIKSKLMKEVLSYMDKDDLDDLLKQM